MDSFPSSGRQEGPPCNRSPHRRRHPHPARRIGRQSQHHLHCRLLDGVYRITEGVPVFHPVHAPTAEQLQALLIRTEKRLMRLLTRKSYLEEAPTYLGEYTAAVSPGAHQLGSVAQACSISIWSFVHTAVAP